MASHLYGFKVRRLGPRDFFRPRESDLIPLPSPLSKFNNGKDLDSSSNSGGDDDDNSGSDSGGGNGGQTKDRNQNDSHDNSNGNGHNDDAGDDSKPSTGEFPCPANGSPNPPFPGCFTVNDNGPFLKYIGSWAVSSLDGNGKGSIHQASVPGAAVEISVDGTGFALFGIIPPSNSTSRPPSATYTVDNNTFHSTVSTLPFATDCQRNQNFFQVSNLAQGNHTITVNVTSASAAAPYIVDYIWICGTSPGFNRGKQTTSSASQSMSTAASASSEETHDDSHNTRAHDAIIVGSVLGSILLLLILTFLACFCIRRRRRRENRLRGLHLAASPVTSWLRSQSGSRETGTVFTSTESIMRDNPTYTSSADSKDLEKARRDVVSMPPSVRFSSTTRTSTRPPLSQPFGMRSPIRRLSTDPTVITTT